MTELADMFVVLFAQGVAWGGIPLCVIACLLPRVSMARVFFLSLTAGIVSQSLLGFGWNHAVGASPAGEILVYVLFWLLAGMGGLIYRFRINRPAYRRVWCEPEDYWLLWVLPLALLVRLLHPLQEAALGQSDAYSHLQFLRQVVADGHVHNRVYPAGFSWIMALPTFLFRLDPYHVARYGGAFWGMLLAWASYEVLARHQFRQAARFASALVAFCPVFYPLLKTGVGMYANQAGLFLLPLLLMAGMESGVAGRLRVCTLLLALALAGTVPMLLLPVLMVLAVMQVLNVSRAWNGWLRRSLWLLVALLPALLVMGWQSLRLDPAHQAETVRLVTAEQVKPMASPHTSPPDAGQSPPAMQQDIRPWALPPLLLDYLRIKRLGYGRWWLNGVAVLPGFLFLGCLIAGLARRNPLLCLLGVWGTLTWWQTLSGMFQFSGYQRAGWSLLLACAWLGGLIGHFLLLRLPRPRWGMRAVYGGLLLCLLATLWLPPAHARQFSLSEGRMIEIVREAVLPVPPERAPIVVVRAFTGFDGWQGDPVRASAGLEKKEILTVDDRADLGQPFRPHRAYLFVLDDAPLNTAALGGVFARLQPQQVAAYIEAQKRFHRFNGRVEQLLERIRQDPRTETVVVHDAQLRVLRFSEVQP